MVTEVKQDIVDLIRSGEYDIAIHGCNCFSTMGAGLALALATEFPGVKLADENDTRSGISKLGDYTFYTLKDEEVISEIGTTVFNLYTQYYPGANLDYVALKLCLRKINMMFSGFSILVPQIGCGLGGGDWDRVRSIVEKELQDCEITLVYY